MLEVSKVMLDIYSWLMQNGLGVVVAVAMLVLAVLLDLVLGGPSLNYPDSLAFKLHPTVLMGKFTKKIEPYLKSKNA